MTRFTDINGRDRLVRLALRLVVSLALLLGVAPLTPEPARADIGACYALTRSVSPADARLAYAFVRDHGECLARLEDTTFQTVTAAVAGAQASGVVSATTCTGLLNNLDSGPAQSLIAVAGADAAYGHLSCACAVVNSGVAKKLVKITGLIADCGSTFDPADVYGAGVNLASGAVDGLGGALGLGGSAHDPRAGVGNGGAPTSFYVCGQVGVWFADTAPGGGCACPGSTRPEWGMGQLKGKKRCVGDCPQGQISSGGACMPCTGGGGSQSGAGGSSWATAPNDTQTQCVKSGGGFSCGDGKIASGGSCVWACPQGEVWDKPSRSCFTCPQGQVPKYLPGLGSMGSCKPCGPDQQAVNGQCQACPAGSTLNAAGICQAGFPPPACVGATINDPANPYRCIACPANQQPDATHRACRPAIRFAPTRPTVTFPRPGTGGAAQPRPPSKPYRGN